MEQTLLPLLDTPLLDIVTHCVRGSLRPEHVRVRPGVAAATVNVRAGPSRTPRDHGGCRRLDVGGSCKPAHATNRSPRRPLVLGASADESASTAGRLPGMAPVAGLARRGATPHPSPEEGCGMEERGPSVCLCTRPGQRPGAPPWQAPGMATATRPHHHPAPLPPRTTPHYRRQCA